MTDFKNETNENTEPESEGSFIGVLVCFEYKYGSVKRVESL